MFLYPIDYQLKKGKIIPPEILIIRGSQDHALVGPLENQPLMIHFIGGFLFCDKFVPIFGFLRENRG